MGLTKPHLRCKGGIWSCATFYQAQFIGLPLVERIGYGYTPQAAYDDWKEWKC